MAILATWSPPSREHWEWITFLWQFFPIVNDSTFNHIENFADLNHTVHALSMALLLLSYGQDIYTVTIQCSWKDRMGDNGSTWVYNLVIYNVLFA